MNVAVRVDGERIEQVKSSEPDAEPAEAAEDVAGTGADGTRARDVKGPQACGQAFAHIERLAVRRQADAIRRIHWKDHLADG